MTHATTETDFGKETDTWSVLEQTLREGARRMLQQALELEVTEYLEKHSGQRDENGNRMVVKNGYHPERNLVTGVGPIGVKAPRIDNLIPVLYLKGVSTNGFGDALASILGEGAKGLSAANIVRLKKGWEDDYHQWESRNLSSKKYAYIWADGVHFNIRLDDQRSCILVIMGADEAGNKELLAVSDGYRGSTLSWKEMLLRLKEQGLKASPKLAIGDGALGFWKALDEVFPETKRQRCWVHKTANILDKMPKSIQVKAKAMIHDP